MQYNLAIILSNHEALFVNLPRILSRLVIFKLDKNIDPKELIDTF